MLLSFVIIAIVAEYVSANQMFGRNDLHLRRLTSYSSDSSPPAKSNIQLSFGDLKLTTLQKLSLNITKLGYNAIRGANMRWKDGIIPYHLHCSVDNLPDAVSSIHKAMKQWEKKTCIRFVEHTDERFYLTFFRDTHCWGNVGQVSYSRISVGHGCEYEHVMAHEIGHAIGLFHEHNRNDRDQFVEVYWDNIGRFKDAFNPSENAETLGIPYDYESIMHYPWSAFSANGKNTMRPRQPTNGKVPYVEISQDDIRLVSKMYNCPAIERKRKQQARRSITKREHDECVDVQKDCPDWAMYGHCKYESVFEACPKSCKNLILCDTSTPKPPTAPSKKTLPWDDSWPNRHYLGTGRLCIDFHKDCEFWANHGSCSTNPGYMLRRCMKSCRNLNFDIVCDEEIKKPPGECANPLGLGSYETDTVKLPDSAFYSPRRFGGADGEWAASASNARLYNEDNYGTKQIGSWCAANHDKTFLQVDLGETRTITYIATQGRPQYFERIAKFRIKYSDTPNNFKFYMDRGHKKLFVGNCDHITPVLNKFKFPIRARYIRYIPVVWNFPCLRMELYGC